MDDGLHFVLPELQEDFEVTEGQTFKGHTACVRDIIKLNSQEFISCDDAGQIIFWNKKKNQMKGFNLKGIDSPVVEPILCLCLTEGNQKFLVGGMKKGHLVFFNRAKGGKKVVS